ncbi:FecCD family ABC transporter permease [Oceanicella actignis]|uniref:Iron complex transport system permease protein n=1 Tax=Oceanicella actignis TaxID=1189325 RepID=A0A1M7SF76_9RHOB|nr:iron chelate uptake ABC transporter family permease subunit [Oceanicella actignis]SET22711.1 iron complex transport system permease protein [Oceanicella actignis]SHN57133.1 iron complex transport system permease protein [Oceanicella actignis]
MMRAVRIGPVCAPLRPRPLAASLGLSLCLAALGLAALAWGGYPLSAGEIWQAATGRGDAVAAMIVLEHRLPRILTAIGAGAALGLAGAMVQTMLRNPLAAPDIIGFVAGANAGALLAALTTGGMIVGGALAGGALTACAVVALAWRGGLDAHRLILVGVGANLTLGATADLLLSFADERTAADMARWLTGTLHARSPEDAALAWAGLALLSPAALWLGFPLGRMALSDDLAAGLGLRLARLRLAVAALAVALVALAVSVAGPLPFVAFVSGPIARRLTRCAGPALAAAALTGATVTLGADLAARMVPTFRLPAGVFAAMAGAPVLVWLLWIEARRRRL